MEIPICKINACTRIRNKILWFKERNQDEKFPSIKYFVIANTKCYPVSELRISLHVSANEINSIVLNLWKLNNFQKKCTDYI